MARRGCEGVGLTRRACDGFGMISRDSKKIRKTKAGKNRIVVTEKAGKNQKQYFYKRLCNLEKITIERRQFVRVKIFYEYIEFISNRRNDIRGMCFYQIKTPYLKKTALGVFSIPVFVMIINRLFKINYPRKIRSFDLINQKICSPWLVGCLFRNKFWANFWGTK